MQVALKRIIQRKDRKNSTDRPKARNYVIQYDRQGFILHGARVLKYNIFVRTPRNLKISISVFQDTTICSCETMALPTTPIVPSTQTTTI
jgi:hypothetical protein